MNKKIETKNRFNENLMILIKNRKNKVTIKIKE